MSFIFLASPYSHPSTAVRSARFGAVCRHISSWKADFSSAKTIYSPIAHWHIAAALHDMPVDHDFWLRHSFAMLRHATELHILDLPGWDLSRGVAAERGFAYALKLPIIHMSYEAQSSEEESLLNTD